MKFIKYNQKSKNSCKEIKVECKYQKNLKHKTKIQTKQVKSNKNYINLEKVN